MIETPWHGRGIDGVRADLPERAGRMGKFSQPDLQLLLTTVEEPRFELSGREYVLRENEPFSTDRSQGTHCDTPHQCLEERGVRSGSEPSHAAVS